MEYSYELVNDACHGDENAFTELYRCIYKDLYRFAFYMLGGEEDAKDVVSETVLDAYVSIAKLRDVQSFHYWIFKILTNKCKRKMKEYAVKNIPLEDIYIHMQTDLEEAFDLRIAFMQLPKQERTIVVLSVFAGYSSGEIGKILHLKSSTVRSKLSRALAKMKIKLEDSL